MSGSPGKAPDAAARHARRVVLGILLTGWTVAAVVWLRAEPAVEDPEVYEAEHSKRITRELERFGGKAAVFTSELDEALARLWQGRTRAYTIAGLSAAAAGAYLLGRAALAAAERDRGRQRAG